MKHISILVLEEAVLGSIVGPHKIFTDVNDILAGMGKPPLFKVNLVGISKETRLNKGLFTVNPELSLEDVQRTDLAGRCLSFLPVPANVLRRGFKYFLAPARIHREFHFCNSKAT
ncbi:hypothetical protein EON78_02280, partial [bacterium]